MLFLENEYLRVAVNQLGTELTSIVRKSDQTEYMWEADPAFWGRHSPLLFPVIGRLKDQEYTLDGKTYTIPKHGFARDMQFEVVSHSDTCLELAISANSDTKAVYPYDFSLLVRYTLDGTALKKEHVVTNHSDRTLYYEVGGHDAYKLTFSDAELSDYYIAFEDTDSLDVIECDETVMLSQSHRTVPLEDGRLYLARDTFIQDALIVGQLPVHRCTLGCRTHARKITMDFPDMRYFAIWSPYKADSDVPFVCLEPWSTLPDGSYLGKELEHKEGIRVLSAGQSETLAFQITID